MMLSGTLDEFYKINNSDSRDMLQCETNWIHENNAGKLF